MLEGFLLRLVTTWNAIAAFRLLLHIEKPSPRRLALLLLGGLAIATAASLLVIPFPGTMSFWITLGLIILLYPTYRRKPNATFLTVMLATGLTFALYLPSVAIVVSIRRLLFGTMYTDWQVNLEIFTVGLLLYLFLRLLFCIPRLRNGIPYLVKDQVDVFGCFLGFGILYIMSVVPVLEENGIPLFGVFALLLLFSILIILWVQYRTKREYALRVRERETETAQKELARQMEENARLSSLLHRDNKLLAAMQMAVDEVLGGIAEMDSANTADEAEANRVLREDAAETSQLSQGDTDKGEAPREPVARKAAPQGKPRENSAGVPENTPEALRARAFELQKELRALAAERSGIVKSYELVSRPLPKTGLPSVDTQLSYMQMRAAEEGFFLDLITDGSVQDAVPALLSETELTTLLADLLENAIHATAAAGGERILLFLGQKEQGFSIEVSDTGIPFPDEVLHSFGKGRLTTRKDEGGSGIGLETVHKITRLRGASFGVTPLPEGSVYTKTVCVSFS